jgi:6-phospho-3-hexuloisomerase
MTPFTTALAELSDAVGRIDPVALDQACALIARSRTILGYGCGREGLQLRGFIMRLHHLGLRVAMQGDMTAPPLAAGDLFLCAAGPGELATVTALMRVAREAGADVLFLTAEPETPSAALATQVLVIPARTMARDLATEGLLPMGSVFEGAMFLTFEVMILDLRARLGETVQGMRTRHTNME